EKFDPIRKPFPRIRGAGIEERQRLAAESPAFGRVVCRCEEVTEGEIVEAVRRGARTVDGVKMRTRASMGRCQGNFCSAKIAAILAREMKQPIEAITKKGTRSNYAG
ncbi:MAG TPA: (2Fe-2S)-binding protein, partial [Syntrophales bacterium]|nr:(2Fe-2S)-binding protein [Syntrophales bacterium]